MPNFFLKPIKSKRSICVHNNIIECGNSFSSIYGALSSYLFMNDELFVVQPSFLNITAQESDALYWLLKGKGVCFKEGVFKPLNDASSIKVKASYKEAIILRLRNAEGMSDNEISALVGIPLASVVNYFEKLREDCLSGRDDRVSDMFLDHDEYI